MDISNSGVKVDLDKEKGRLLLSNLLEETMVYLYDAYGDLVYKQNVELHTVDFSISQHGVYVLVLSHPNCQPEVRRVVYSAI